MDLQALKKKMESLKKESSSEKKDYSNIYWKPPVGKSTVRILPATHLENGNAIDEVKVYYGIGKPVMISPLEFGKEDPIAAFASKLNEGEYDKEKFILSKKLEPKSRYFAPVIVRGEEDKGVRLWQFGIQTFEELASLALDEEIGDFTDIINGRDIKVRTTSPDENGTPYNKSSVSVALSTSPVGTDKNNVEKWLNEQPNPRDQFKLYSFEEMKEALAKWLTPDSNEEEEQIFPKKNESAPKKDNSYQLKEKPKKSEEDEFEELFGSNATDFENED